MECVIQIKGYILRFRYKQKYLQENPSKIIISNKKTKPIVKGHKKLIVKFKNLD